MPPADLFYPDAGQSEQQKQLRERRFHTIDVPRLRLSDSLKPLALNARAK